MHRSSFCFIPTYIPRDRCLYGLSFSDQRSTKVASLQLRCPGHHQDAEPYFNTLLHISSDDSTQHFVFLRGLPQSANFLLTPVNGNLEFSFTSLSPSDMKLVQASPWNCVFTRLLWEMGRSQIKFFELVQSNINRMFLDGCLVQYEGLESSLFWLIWLEKSNEKEMGP